MTDDWDAEWEDEKVEEVVPQTEFTKVAVDEGKKEKRAVLVIIAVVLVVLLVGSIIFKLFEGSKGKDEAPGKSKSQVVATKSSDVKTDEVPKTKKGDDTGVSDTNVYLKVSSVKLGKVKESIGVVSESDIIMFSDNSVGYRVTVLVNDGGKSRNVVFFGTEKFYESFKKGTSVKCEYSLTGQGGTSGRSLTLINS